MKPRIVRSIRRLFLLLAGVAPLAMTACDDGFEPLLWGNFPDTVELYSLARGEYVDRPGAYDLLDRQGVPVVVEVDSRRRGPFQFDFAVTEDEAGTFLLLPTGVFQEATARPGLIADSAASFEGLSRAPRDGYITEEAIPADTTVVYAVRSRRAPNGCLVYGKMEILGMTPDGIMTIRTLVNRNCGDRSLVPNAPEEDDEDAGEG